MAKKDAAPSETDTPATPAALKPNPVRSAIALPEGFQQTASDVDQFWNEEGGPIQGVLLCGKNYLNKLAGKVNSIYVIRLTSPCKSQTNKGDGFENPAQPGELVGVWGAPGLKDLMMMGGCEVHITRNGEKDVGKPSKMKVYAIGYKGRMTKLAIIRDGEAKVEASNGAAPATDGTNDALPF